MNAHQITLRKVQTSRKQTYASHACDPYVFYCYETVPCQTRHGVIDLKVGDISCGVFGECPYQHQCVAPDPGECDIGNSSNGENPLTFIGWDKEAPNIKCVFDLAKIDRIDQLNQYKKQFNGEFVGTVNSTFCEQKVNTCPTGFTGEGCSRLRSVGDDGEFCRSWLATLPSKEADAIMQNYCLLNNTTECKCINRLNDPEYQRTKKVAPFSDNCWYKPCAVAQSIYLVPHELDERTDCPKNICQQIIDVADARKVDINDIKTNINCSFTDSGSKNTEPKQDDDSTQKSINKYWIISLSILVLIVGVIVVVLFLPLH